MSELWRLIGPIVSNPDVLLLIGVILLALVMIAIFWKKDQKVTFYKSEVKEDGNKVPV